MFWTVTTRLIQFTGVSSDHSRQDGWTTGKTRITNREKRGGKRGQDQGERQKRRKGKRVTKAEIRRGKVSEQGEEGGRGGGKKTG